MAPRRKKVASCTDIPLFTCKKCNTIHDKNSECPKDLMEADSDEQPDPKPTCIGDNEPGTSASCNVMKRKKGKRKRNRSRSSSPSTSTSSSSSESDRSSLRRKMSKTKRRSRHVVKAKKKKYARSSSSSLSSESDESYHKSRKRYKKKAKRRYRSSSSSSDSDDSQYKRRRKTKQSDDKYGRFDNPAVYLRCIDDIRQIMQTKGVSLRRACRKVKKNERSIRRFKYIHRLQATNHEAYYKLFDAHSGCLGKLDAECKKHVDMHEVRKARGTTVIV